MSNLFNQIKDLRDQTGAGFVDCKKSLIESDGDIEKAIEILRKKGASRALNKSKRSAKEGVVCLNISKNKASLIEINTETDFVAKNSDFLDYVKKISSQSLLSNNIDELLAIKDSDDLSTQETLTRLISKIGENIVIKRMDILNHNEDTKIYGYVHNKYQENIGKIGCLLRIKSKIFDEELNNIAKNICMHIAALKPISIDIKNLNKNLIEKEKSIILENIKSSGKPDNIIQNILEGKIKKFYEEVVLLEQKYIIDNEFHVKDIINNYAKKSNNDIFIDDFRLYILGN